MDRKQMEEFFKAVGFVPPSDDEQGASGPTAGAEGPGGSTTVGSDPDGWTVIGGGKRRGSKGGGGKGGDGGDAGGGDGGLVDFFMNRLPAWSKKALIFLAIVVVLVLVFLYWWFHPPINIHSQDTWSFILIFILLPLFLFFTGRRRAYEKGSGKIEASPKKAKAFRFLSYIPAALAILGIIGAIAGWSFWPGNAERYSSILPIENTDFATDIQEVDYNSIPVIAGESAQLLGNRTLGEIPEYVSQFEISSLYSQINYQQRPVRVSPLNYADFFKWFYNMNTGIPAYVLVDMASQDTRVVRLEQPIYYSESDPFFKNIDRHVQLSYPFYMFEQKSFEIDEDGTPWWICPVQTRTIGLFGGETIERVVLVNANSGETFDYAIEDVPQWVDRAYPSDLLIQQYNWYGSLHNGWLNSWLGQSGVVQTTPGTSGFAGYNYIAKDDDVWLYTGVTSATADNAIIGFVLVNQRTGDAHFYSVAGATEESAMRSAEGQVQNLRYVSTFPLLLNINGQPTYFMALKDAAGLVKKFAMIDIQRYQNVAVGDTVAECQKSYKTLLTTNGIAVGGDAGDLTAKGTIASIATAVVDGNSHFYLMLDGDSNIYDCALPTLIEVVGFGVGDTVELKYFESDPTCTVSEISGRTAAGTHVEAAAANRPAISDEAAAMGAETADGVDAGAEVSGAASPPAA